MTSYAFLEFVVSDLKGRVVSTLGIRYEREYWKSWYQITVLIQEWFRPSVICLTKCTFLVRHIKLTYVPGLLSVDLFLRNKKIKE